SGSPWESNIKKVVIENGVTNIGESAFYGCENLTDITIPDSVRSICQYSFLDCTNLTDITTSDSVTRIDDGAFSKELTNKDKLTAGKIYTAKFTLAPFESHMFTEDTKVTLNGVEAKPTSDDFCREVE
ncbi:MAG: leucine-rich repeat domain-containing protein, partial [Ruminococcus sp.]|nr:leucine-rich repeat domain-containing protein [Ruminococcus sp.]